jgi:hypothetical protein
LPGRLARQTCPEDLPSRHARQTKYLPGRINISVLFFRILRILGKPFLEKLPSGLGRKFKEKLGILGNTKY